MSYNLLNPVHAIVDGDMSLSSITSAVIEVKLQDNIGVQLHWTGAPVGSVDVQVSMNHLEDSLGNIVVAGQWISLPISPSISIAGSPDDAYIELTELSCPYIRLVYTATSGTGVLNCYFNGKGV